MCSMASMGVLQGYAARTSPFGLVNYVRIEIPIRISLMYRYPLTTLDLFSTLLTP